MSAWEKPKAARRLDLVQSEPEENPASAGGEKPNLDEYQFGQTRWASNGPMPVPCFCEVPLPTPLPSAPSPLYKVKSSPGHTGLFLHCSTSFKFVLTTIINIWLCVFLLDNSYLKAKGHVIPVAWTAPKRCLGRDLLGWHHLSYVCFRVTTYPSWIRDLEWESPPQEGKNPKHFHHLVLVSTPPRPPPRLVV